MVVVDAIDDRAVHFYQAHGFIKLPESMRLILSMRTIAELASAPKRPAGQNSIETRTKNIQSSIMIETIPNAVGIALRIVRRLFDGTLCAGSSEAVRLRDGLPPKRAQR
jgi:hypothetical protein